MIWQWLMDAWTSIQLWIVSLFPSDFTVPDFFVHFDATLNGVIANLNGVGAWIDWPVAIACVSATVLVWGVAATIKLVRAVASYLPFFGGAG